VTSHARTPAGGTAGSSDLGAGTATTVLEAADVARIVDRMAHQIIESVARTSTPERGFDAVLLGIPTRGVPLAQRLAERIRVFAGA
jgi:pyrimidine operon attenuation protein/uracil phosphoribosyltransferase